MLGLGKKKPVPEHEAEGEIERVYHEIRQVLRVTGVNLNLRTWATFDKFLPPLWDALRPNLETRAFETAADRVRSDAVDAATDLPRLDAVASGMLGESQRFQIQRALDLYHYINPKLLVLTSAVRLALDGETIGADVADAPEQIGRGQPAKMFPMEMVAEEPEEKELRDLFDDIKPHSLFRRSTAITARSGFGRIISRQRGRSSSRSSGNTNTNRRRMRCARLRARSPAICRCDSSFRASAFLNWAKMPTRSWRRHGNLKSCCRH